MIINLNKMKSLTLFLITMMMFACYTSIQTTISLSTTDDEDYDELDKEIPPMNNIPPKHSMKHNKCRNSFKLPKGKKCSDQCEKVKCCKDNCGSTGEKCQFTTKHNQCIYKKIQTKLQNNINYKENLKALTDNLNKEIISLNKKSNDEKEKVNKEMIKIRKEFYSQKSKLDHQLAEQTNTFYKKQHKLYAKLKEIPEKLKKQLKDSNKKHDLKKQELMKKWKASIKIVSTIKKNRIGLRSGSAFTKKNIVPKSLFGRRKIEKEKVCPNSFKLPKGKKCADQCNEEICCKKKCGSKGEKCNFIHKDSKCAFSFKNVHKKK